MTTVSDDLRTQAIQKIRELQLRMHNDDNVSLPDDPLEVFEAKDIDNISSLFDRCVFAYFCKNPTYFELSTIPNSVYGLDLVGIHTIIFGRKIDLPRSHIWMHYATFPSIYKAIRCLDCKAEDFEFDLDDETDFNALADRLHGSPKIWKLVDHIMLKHIAEASLTASPTTSPREEEEVEVLARAPRRPRDKYSGSPRADE